MTSEIDIGTRHAPGEVNKQLAGQDQREGATVKINTWCHPFDWCDFLLFIVPIAIIVFAIW